MSARQHHATRNTLCISRFTLHANVILTGFMGTGKTKVGREVARRLGREFVDMDDVIAQRACQSIPAIFAREGEAVFRHLEAKLCQELSQRRDLVIATGGGALIPEANRRCMEASGFVVCLNCAVEEVLRRLANAGDRPLLEVADRRAEIERLLEHRQRAYGAMPAQLDTTRLTMDEAAERVISLWHSWQQERAPEQPMDAEAEAEAEAEGVLSIQSPDGDYNVHLGRGALTRLGERLKEAGLGEPVDVVSNPTVWQFHGQTVEEALRAAGYTCFITLMGTLMPDGEQHKTLATVSRLYESFVEGGLERGSTIVAVGGGVVGDVAGFAAATYMRGVSLVQVPTTLLSMVDSSVGGKTGVNLPQGKNLVGAFKQPALVVTDPNVLHTLPPVELRSGLAEIVKASIIGDPALFEHLEECSGHPLARPPRAHCGEATESADVADAWHWPWIIRRALEVKIRVVEEDPLEHGRRAVLNLGHTVGHALERLSGYSLRHGEAVSTGLVAAARLAVAMNTKQDDTRLLERLTALLCHLGLPTTVPDYDPVTIWEAMQGDKKRRGKALRWVLPRALGDVLVTDEVSPADVLAVLESMCNA